MTHQQVEEEHAHGHNEDDPQEVGDDWEQKVVALPFTVKLQYYVVRATHCVHYDAHQGVPHTTKWRVLWGDKC